MEMYFDGYCPESLLKGDKVEMRLNEDDFWESEATGLQLTVFPPFAAILKWRGQGKFRKSSAKGSDTLSGLLMTEAKTEEGQEIFPDETKIIQSAVELEWYLHSIYAGRKEFEAAKFDSKDPAIQAQALYLYSLKKEDLQQLIALFEGIKQDGYSENFTGSNHFTALHEMLYEIKLIFDFEWMSWKQGWKHINDPEYNFSRCSILDISMYLTAIFRADRFNEGIIEANFRNGTLKKIFNVMRQLSM